MKTEVNIDARKERRRQFALDVKRMRALGVLRWGAIVLGPPPAEKVEKLSPKEQLEREKELLAREKERKHETMFAASSIRPRLGSGE